MRKRVWELAEHRSIVIEQNDEQAGHAIHTVVVDDFDRAVGQIVHRGSRP